ncbi:hypothetical protein Salat_0885500 [Sesamum alatum]|uniref:Secreted protein n=1 Tax=Sesamum alatum TaxID=300844 RepID=A0AAE1YJ30_9LAMI|nr:hypothetical protein Salat_0885500 [Sesamum alatum]
MRILPMESSSIVILITVVLSTTFLPTTIRSNPTTSSCCLRTAAEDEISAPLTSEPSLCPSSASGPTRFAGVMETYWCGCADAHCAGVRVKKSGFAKVGSGGSRACGQALLCSYVGSYYLGCCIGLL